MRIVLATIGTRGDVQPILALGQALARRGHTPVVACPARFAPWVESMGFAHVTLGEDLQSVMRPEKGSPMSAFVDYLSRTTAQQFETLLEATRGADAIVGGAIAYGVPSVAAKLSIPALQIVFSTSTLPSHGYPPPGVKWQSWPRWLNGLLWRITIAAQERFLRSPVNEGRAKIGLPPVGSFHQHIFVDTPYVIAADEQLLPPDPAWKGRNSHVGFLFLDDPTPLDPELDAWLSDGEPPVYVGFGSMDLPAIDRANAALRSAIAATGRRCLVAAGWAGLGAGELPSTFKVVREAPHHLVFPRVAAVVHHGGVGTMAAALRAGVPQVILPAGVDQFLHAHVLVRAGLAAEAPSMAQITATALAKAIEQAVRLPEGPRRTVAERLRKSRASDTIAEMLERMVAAPRA